MLKIGDVVKHRNATFMGSKDPLIGIVENADVSTVCHVRTLTNFSYDSNCCLYILKHRDYIYSGRDHLESNWELLC